MDITKDKITEIFCIIADFCQEYDKNQRYVLLGFWLVKSIPPTSNSKTVIRPFNGSIL